MQVLSSIVLTVTKLFLTLVLILALLIVRGFRLNRESALFGADHSVWVCQADTFSITIDPSQTDSSKDDVTLVIGAGEPIALMEIGVGWESRDVFLYPACDGWAPGGKGHVLSFTPFYFADTAICINVKSIYPEIAEKPFLIFKRID